MNLWMTTIFTYTDVSTIGTGLTVDDTVCNLRLHREGEYFSRYPIESKKISCTVGLTKISPASSLSKGL